MSEDLRGDYIDELRDKLETAKARTEKAVAACVEMRKVLIACDIHFAGASQPPSRATIKRVLSTDCGKDWDGVALLKTSRELEKVEAAFTEAKELLSYWSKKFNNIIGYIPDTDKLAHIFSTDFGKEEA